MSYIASIMDKLHQQRIDSEFFDRVADEGIIESWYMGHISNQELIDRLEFIRANAPDVLRRDREGTFND